MLDLTRGRYPALSHRTWFVMADNGLQCFAASDFADVIDWLWNNSQYEVYVHTDTSRFTLTIHRGPL